MSHSNEERRQGIKGLDIIGIVLILLSVVLLLALGQPEQDPMLGGYGLGELAPLLPAAIGAVLVVVARFKK
ncbi:MULTISPECIES: hypothetical protein [Halomonas]|uniref:DUF3309 domain-containing protein n=1 Tax=Halomonas halophila TaxID=29573 RepID=A0ABQ0TZA4_9GAMM|nr:MULTISPECIES: hypothetical protein [Halomonas]MDR5889657.1 hypothetical protein [Halomonas salina]WJY06339.1 hypothetical protein QWG60_11535 [Halomonas halophila]GEK71574.1 hypothetical protein HHA04nite_01180 [Halomonas halophila]